MATQPAPNLLAEATSGALFGAALLLSGVSSPAVIHAQLHLSKWHMLQTFLGGSACSALILDLAHRYGIYTKSHPAPRALGLFPYDGNVLGGALIGLGMAATGACPGTAIVQFGEGTWNGALVVFGGVLGTGTFVKVGPMLLRNFQQTGCAETASTTTTDVFALEEKPSPPPSPTIASPQTKALDIPTALSLQPLTALLIWVPLCLTIIALAKVVDGSSSTSPLPAVGLLPPAYGGILIGLAQAGTVLLTRHHLGASSAYEDLARWAGEKFSGGANSGHQSRRLMTPSMTFATGIVVSVAILQTSILGPKLTGAERTIALSLPSIARTIAGGASMVFGARLAGGCTSGHGISGLSKFSLASAATTAAIFAGGILSAQILGA